jgi:ubiquinone biosynthesis protein
MGTTHLVTTIAASVVGIVIFLLLLTTVSRRLLAVRIGRVRATLAALVGLGAEFGFESRVVWPAPSPMLALVPLQVGIVFLVAIAFLVLGELVVPTGTWPRPDKWVTALRGKLARARRYSQIVRIASRHGLLPVPRPRGGPAGDRAAVAAETARGLRLALQEAGVAFVKLGQQLSTRRDLLPEEFIVELSRLQQQVAPVGFDDIEAVLTSELGAGPGEVFAAFCSEPLAAASIGQTHRARLPDGTEVVVKVQRPGIRPLVERDLDIALRLARSLQDTTGWGRSLGVAELAAGFAAALTAELDFRIEAENIAAVAAAMAGHEQTQVVIPARFPELCTQRVLVMEFLAGTTLSDPQAASELPAARRETDAAALFDSLLRQVMLDGVFHADPHPGNLMVLADGRLALIDFGSVGRLDAGLRAGLQNVFLAVEHEDPQELFDALFDLLIRPDQLDEQRLRRDLGRFLAQHLSFGAGLDPAMFTELLRLITAYELGIPAEAAAAFRAFATMEGSLTALDPGFDMLSQARSFAAGQLHAGLHPSAIQDALTSELTSVLPLLRRLPRHLDQVAAALEDGRLRMNIRLLADRRDRAVVTEWLHLAALTFLGGSTGLMAALLLGTTAGPAVTPTMTLFQLFGYLLVVVSAILILRVLFDIFRGGRRN